MAGAGYLFSAVEAPLADAAHGLGVKLGDGSDGIILQGSTNGNLHRVPIDITIPPDQPTGSIVKLTAANYGILKLWTNDGADAAPIGWDTGTPGTVTWVVGTNNAPPDEIWVGAIGGSTNMRDIHFSLSDSEQADGGVFAPTVSVSSKSATAAMVKITSNNDPNPGEPTGDVTGRTRDWLVGQYAEMTATLEAPQAIRAGASYEWNVPGRPYADYNPTDFTSTVAAVPLDSHTGAAYQKVKFFWDNTENDSGAVEENVRATVAVGGASYTSSTIFELFAPTTTIPEDIQAGYVGKSRDGNSVGLYPNAGMLNGIIFPASVTMPAPFTLPGTWGFVQLIMDNHTWIQRDGKVLLLPNTGVWALDNEFPYGVGTVGAHGEKVVNPPYDSNAGWSTNLAIGRFTDGPAADLNTFRRQIQAAERDFRAIATVLFLPPGNGSRYVPLVALKWSFYTLTEIGTHPDATGSFLTIIGKRGPSVGDPTVTDKFPEWSKVDVNNMYPH